MTDNQINEILEGDNRLEKTLSPNKVRDRIREAANSPAPAPVQKEGNNGS